MTNQQITRALVRLPHGEFCDVLAAVVLERRATNKDALSSFLKLVAALSRAIPEEHRATIACELRDVADTVEAKLFRTIDT